MHWRWTSNHLVVLHPATNLWNKRSHSNYAKKHRCSKCGLDQRFNDSMVQYISWISDCATYFTVFDVGFMNNGWIRASLYGNTVGPSLLQQAHRRRQQPPPVRSFFLCRAQLWFCSHFPVHISYFKLSIRHSLWHYISKYSITYRNLMINWSKLCINCYIIYLKSTWLQPAPCKKAAVKCREKSTRLKDFSSLHVTELGLHGNISVTLAPDIQEVLARQTCEKRVKPI